MGKIEKNEKETQKKNQNQIGIQRRKILKKGQIFTILYIKTKKLLKIHYKMK